MIIKIGQLQTAITTAENMNTIRLGVENAMNKYAPLLGEALDFHNVRQIGDEQWFETLEILNLMELFYHEKDGLFTTDGDISPLNSRHFDCISQAHDNFFENHPTCKEMKYAMVGIDGRLSRGLPVKEDLVAGHIRWLRFWIRYAIHFCSKPVIANVEFVEMERIAAIK